MESNNSDNNDCGQSAILNESDCTILENAAEVLNGLLEEVALACDPSSFTGSSSGSEEFSIFTERFGKLSLQDSPERFTQTCIESNEPYVPFKTPWEYSLPTFKDVGCQTDSASTALSKMEMKLDLEVVNAEASEALCLMQILIEENKSLRKQVLKLEHVIRLIMSKFRKSVTFLLNELEESKKIFPCISQTVKTNNEKKCAKLDEIELEMKEIMKHAIKLDDYANAQHEKQIGQLQLENEELRKLLKISKDYEVNLHFQSNKSSQTEAITDKKAQTSAASNLQDIDSDDSDSVTSQDSYHTAIEVKTPYGSFSSPFLEVELENEICENKDIKGNLEVGVGVGEVGFDGSGDSELV